MSQSWDADSINQKLKAAGVRLTIVVRNRKLSLRGTLPPRPGQTEAKQTYLALGLDATPYGFKTALAKALRIWAELGENKFNWADWMDVDTSNPDSCKSVIDRYKTHWFQQKGDTEKTRAAWNDREWLPALKWLPPEENLTAEILKTIVQTKAPNTRSRQIAIQVLTRLAKFAQIDIDLNPYKGNYSPAKVQPRDLPTDEAIAKTRAKIKNQAWQLVYTRMAVYGLRDHECWMCEIDSLPPYACQVLNGKTGSRDNVMPLYPEWARDWRPWEGKLPQVNCGDNHKIYGDRTARAFHRQGVEFNPYSLRHAYAIRGSVIFQIPPSVMAAMMGHSPSIHLEIYNRWISAAQHKQVYLLAVNHAQAPKAPILITPEK